VGVGTTPVSESKSSTKPNVGVGSSPTTQSNNSQSKN